MAEIRYVDWDGLLYYDGKIKQYVDDKTHDCLKVGGIVPHESLPTPSYQSLNYIYKITDSFTAGDLFAPELRGHVYDPGTWVQVTDINNAYLYTVFLDINASTDDYKNLEEAVGVLQCNMTALNTEVGGKIDGLVTEVSKKANASNVDELSKCVNGLTTSVLNVLNDVIELNDRIDDLESNTSGIEGITTDVSETKGRVSSLEKSVSNLNISYAQMTSIINGVSNEVETIEDRVKVLENRPEVDLTPYAKTTALEGLATETFVKNAIAEAELNEKDVDLDGYATKDDLKIVEDKIPSVDGFLKESDIVGLGYATQQWVTERNYLTEHQDISGKADKSYVDDTLLGYAKKDDLGEYATKTYVNDEVAKIKVPTNVSELTNDALYITLQDVEDNGYLKEIPSTYVTESELNDRGFITNVDDKADVNHTHTLQDITDYVATDLTGYATESFVNEMIAKAELGDKDITLDDYYTKEQVDALIPDTSNLATKDELPSVDGFATTEYVDGKFDEVKTPVNVSELYNDAGYITASDIPDTSSFITMKDVEDKGYLTEHQPLDDYAKKVDIPTDYLTANDIEGKADKGHTHSYNELEDKPTIPSVEGLATEQYVDEAISQLDIPTVDTSNLVTIDALTVALGEKANDIVFTDDYRVTTPVGSFEQDETVQGMTLSSIFTKLLGLVIYIPPVIDDDIPVGTPESAKTIITDSIPTYMLGEDNTPVENTYTYVSMTLSEAKSDNQTDSFFYQIIDESTNEAIETGYQIATMPQENNWMTVYIPNIVKQFHVEVFDAAAGDWAVPNWKFVENKEYTLEGYTPYTVDENSEIESGIAVRIVIEE